MKTAYFNCSSGISGDMVLGALLDAGAKMATLRHAIKALGLQKGVTIKTEEVKRAGCRALRVHIKISRNAPRPGRYSEVRKIIEACSLSSNIRKKSLAAMRRIFEAEASVHGSTYRTVRLHEMGSADTIIDIVGTMALMEELEIKHAIFSPVNLGSGTVKSAHGFLPVPAFATQKLLEGATVFSTGVQQELTTPTGAAIVAVLSQKSETGQMDAGVPPMTVLATGTGAGSADIPGAPNVLSVIIGQGTAHTAIQEVLEIQTNIDDMDPRIYPYVMDRLFEAGALDVYLTPIIMKKSRPATLLCVLCNVGQEGRMCEIIFNETTTLGIRFSRVSRNVLKRKFRKVKTRYGVIRIKQALDADGKVLRESVEYEDAKAAALKHGVALQKVIKAVGVKFEGWGDAPQRV